MISKQIFRILIVEDEAPKASKLFDFIKKEGQDNLSITISKSVDSGLLAINSFCPDLLILDMSLPTFDISEEESGWRPQPFGGVEILRNLVLLDLSCPAVVITGYEAFPGTDSQPVELSKICSDLTNEFGPLFVGAVHYNSTTDSWKHELGEILKTVNFPRNQEVKK